MKVSLYSRDMQGSMTGYTVQIQCTAERNPLFHQFLHCRSLHFALYPSSVPLLFAAWCSTSFNSTPIPFTMLKVATLFALLATLAHAKWIEGYAPEENAPCYVDGQDGTIQGALCVVVSHPGRHSLQTERLKSGQASPRRWPAQRSWTRQAR